VLWVGQHACCTQLCTVWLCCSCGTYFATSAALYTQPDFKGVPMVFRVSPGIGMCTPLPAPYTANLSSIAVIWNVQDPSVAPGSTPVVCGTVSVPAPTATCSGGWCRLPSRRGVSRSTRGEPPSDPCPKHPWYCTVTSVLLRHCTILCLGRSSFGGRFDTRTGGAGRLTDVSYATGNIGVQGRLVFSLVIGAKTSSSSCPFVCLFGGVQPCMVGPCSLAHWRSAVGCLQAVDWCNDVLSYN